MYVNANVLFIGQSYTYCVPIYEQSTLQNVL